MIEFMRTLFGMKETGKRKVVGAPVDFGVQEIAYINDSTRRLTQLQELGLRYKGTPQAAKMKAVYEKTKNIHTYLVSRKKFHDLELFHLKNTDHFLTTFTAILDVHQKHALLSQGATGASGTIEVSAQKSQVERLKRLEKIANLPDLVQPITNSVKFYNAGEARTAVPRLYVPDISINTVEKVTYYTEGKSEELVAKQIGFTSSKDQKEAFQHHLALRLGLKEVSYVGNALVTIPNNNGIQPTGIVPVIHWEGFLYALNLNDYRLFPVRIYRNGGK
ncbi:hypothetical protein ACD591_08525 [Rufibacter glacialis]|uniref:Uncharacterized protein n=1 Tax=Rufibacter glacialis TaxID=1259555 RepID=A0A5M8QBN9_9BACT|nr:hypothetical protein [Rufibacter glacialis]KAA6432513.1 hypothetical protein FOE74_15575 [Rufibacter glacialis]GGK79331.1 hypothetical protein GCM10011405_29010 [Rufibacter glacialis]